MKQSGVLPEKRGKERAGAETFMQRKREGERKERRRHVEGEREKKAEEEKLIGEESRTKSVRPVRDRNWGE